MRLSKAKPFTELDLRGAYNLVRLAKGEEWKTVFRSHFGHYKYKVIRFGLTNAPASLQHFISDILPEYLDVFYTAFIDDILVYSDTLEEHQTHVRLVLLALQKASLYLKSSKC